MFEIFTFFFYKLPEAYLLIIAALGLLGLKIQPGRLLLAGLGLGILTEISRFYLLKLGLHTPVILLGLTLALIFGFRLSISTAITGCFLSFFLLRLGESLIVSPILMFTKINFQHTLNNPWLYILFGWLSASFLVAASLICHLGGIAIIKAPEASAEEGQKG